MTTRIATKKEDGRQYIVTFLDFQRKIVRVLGEVHKCQGCKTYHEKGFNMDLSDVEISKVQKDEQLCQRLFAQGVNKDVEDGKIEVTRIGGRKNTTVYYKNL